MNKWRKRRPRVMIAVERNSQQVQPQKIGNVLIHPKTKVLCSVFSFFESVSVIYLSGGVESNNITSGGQNFKKLNIPIMEVGRG